MQRANGMAASSVEESQSVSVLRGSYLISKAWWSGRTLPGMPGEDKVWEYWEAALLGWGCPMRWLLVLVLTSGSALSAVALDNPPGQFPAAETDEAWAKLPKENPPLPAWAKMLVGPLPRATARMLELDYFHRE